MMWPTGNGGEVWLSECPHCAGYGIRDSGASCKTCGGCGELFNGMKFSDYQKQKKAASPTPPPAREEAP